MKSYKNYLIATGRLLSSLDKERTIGHAAIPLALPAPIRTNAEQIAAAREMWQFMGFKIDYILPGTYEALIDENLVDITADE